MHTSRFTGIIKTKGWKVEDALNHWGRPYSWYHRNAKGTEAQQTRLECMCKGLPDQTEKAAGN